MPYSKRKHGSDADVPAAEFNPQLFYRAATIRAADVKDDGPTTLTFSSEARVGRWYGVEILKHGQDNVDLSRLREIGAVLFNHNPNAIVGPIVRAEIGADRRGHAEMAFDEDDASQRTRGKVKSGSLRGISVGYTIEKARRVLDDEAYDDPDLGPIKGPALIAERWTPIEISLTPIPADSHVGVGRDATRSLDGIEFEHEDESRQGSDPMDKRMRAYLEARGLDPKANEEAAWKYLAELEARDKARAEAEAKAAAEADAAAKRQDAPPQATAPDPAAMQREAVKRLGAVYSRAAAVGQTNLAMKLAEDGQDDRTILLAVLEAAGKERGTPLGNAGQAQANTRLDDLSDDDLREGITNPRMMLAD